MGLEPTAGRRGFGLTRRRADARRSGHGRPPTRPRPCWETTVFGAGCDHDGARDGSEAIPRRRASLTFVGRAKWSRPGAPCRSQRASVFGDLLQEGRPVRRVGVDPPVGIDVFDGASPTRTGDLLVRFGRPIRSACDTHYPARSAGRPAASQAWAPPTTSVASIPNRLRVAAARLDW